MEDTKKIKFKYIFADDYNPKYVNGAYGGITPRDEIVLNFFFERHGIPISQSHKLANNGTLGEEIEIEPNDHKDSLIRYTDIGVILSLKNAIVIKDFLSAQIERLEQDAELKKEVKKRKMNKK